MKNIRLAIFIIIVILCGHLLFDGFIRFTEKDYLIYLFIFTLTVILVGIPAYNIFEKLTKEK